MTAKRPSPKRRPHPLSCITCLYHCRLGVKRIARRFRMSVKTIHGELTTAGVIDSTRKSNAVNPTLPKPIQARASRPRKRPPSHTKRKLPIRVQDMTLTERRAYQRALHAKPSVRAKRNARTRQWRATNRERVAEYNRNWTKANPGRTAVYRRRSDIKRKKMHTGQSGGF